MQRNPRKHPRLAVNLKIAYSSQVHSGDGLSLDLSLGGMFLQLTEPFEPGDSIELQFQVNVGAERRPVVCQGNVVRVVSPDQARSTGWMPGVGLELHDFRQGLNDLRGFLAERLRLPLAEMGAAPAARPVAASSAGSSAPAARPAPAAASMLLSSGPAARPVQGSTVVSSGPAARPTSATAASVPPSGPAARPASAPPFRPPAEPTRAPSRVAAAQGRSKLAANPEEEADWKSQIHGRKAAELVNLIEQAKAQVAVKPRSRWREVVGLAFRSAVIAACVSVLAYCLMHFRVIPWDLTTWEETVWMGFEESTAPPESAHPAARSSNRTVQAANDFLAEQEQKLKKVKGPYDEKLREGGVDPDTLGIGDAAGPGGRPLTELEKSRAGYDLRKKEMSELDKALPSRRTPKPADAP